VSAAVAGLGYSPPSQSGFGLTCALEYVTCAIVRLTGGRLFCEFQDPLLGATMTRSSMTRRISARIEAWLARRSTRAVYVTQEAARLARERNPEHARQIVGVYPGAWQFVPPVAPGERGKGEVFEFLHLGTLYGSRNLDLFFEALDALRDEGFELARVVRVVNLGAVYCETAPRYLARSDFQSLDALDRVDALRRARQASCLMLVQHTDERSRETIPYKTYDYLNLRLPVFGLLNSDELSALIESHGGHTAQADDPEAIKAALRHCLNALAETGAERHDVDERLEISRQFLQILEGADAER
jgi:pimeloyl-ACP methyl ester carboxylesterase